MNIKVQGFHIDLYGHVNNARYLEFFEASRWEYIEGKQLNYLFPLININVDFIAPAFFGDVLSVTTELKQFTKRSITLAQSIHRVNKPQLLTKADVTLVAYDPVLKKSISLNDEIIALFQPPGLQTSG